MPDPTESDPNEPDPFDTTGQRAAVLAAWAGSPTRFREDANAEEDLRLDGYAEAWLVELAQNAADAARAGGVPGRMRVRLIDHELRVANTGAQLDGAGVAALTSLRASAKRDDAGSVGRFGVGFTAVLPLSARPRLLGSGGGVTFSAQRTAAEVAVLPGPAAELARRDEPPVLRLAWPTVEAPPPGYAGEVVLPLRAGVDGAALLEQARAGAADLLLVLPELVEIEVGGTTFTREPGDDPDEVVIDGRRWRLARRGGALSADTARQQATEQRTRHGWTVCWALPLTADGHPDPLDDDVLHAPTATRERLGLPARLVATLPLEPDRRRVRPGPAADAVLAAAPPAYLDLVLSCPPGERLMLVPPAGFPRSELDGRLRELLLDTLAGHAWLPGADGTDLVPGRAEWLDLPGADPALPALLTEAGFDRLTAPVPPGSAAVLAELGVHRLGADELVDRLLEVNRDPGWWRRLYAALEPATETVPGLAAQLRGLPVPLVDGRLAAGPASVLLPEAALDLGGGGPARRVAALGLTGLHIAAAEAVHPLLRRLGAGDTDPGRLLEHPALVEAVERSVDDAEAGLDPTPLAEAVLDLVGALAAPQAGQLGALALPDADRDPRRADELMLPDAAVRTVLALDTPIGVLDETLSGRFPRSSWLAIGVLDGFALIVDDEPVAPEHDLDEEEDWWDGLPDPPQRLVAVRDLDLVDEACWPAALALLAADRDTRAAITTPGGYTGWWLARHARLHGHPPGHYRLPGADTLVALFDPVPASGLDEQFMAAIGVRADLTVHDPDDAAEMLARLADPARHPDPALTAAAHAALADAVLAGRVAPADLDPPSRVRALDGSVADTDFAMVLDAAWHAGVLSAGELVAGGDPGALAELLDLPLATDVLLGEPADAGRVVRWRDVGEVVLACHQLRVEVPPGAFRLHDELWVDLTRPVRDRFRVPVWRCDETGWHAEDPVRALLGVLGDADR